MAKVNLKDATKGLVEEASGILEKATGIRKGADALFNALRQMDQEFSRQKDEEAQRRKQQEQLKAQSAHAKAFTMLDDDEKQMMEAAMQEQTEKPAAESAEAAPAGKEAEPEKKEKKAEKAEKPAEPETPMQTVFEPEPKKPARPEPPKKPAIGQIISRPGDAPRPGVPRTAAQQGPYGRPAGGAAINFNRQQGQGPYGRPAGQGQYGRPAGGQQGGPYGRPAGQGQYGRPAGGQQGGQYGRPAGGAQGSMRGGAGSRTRTPELAVPMEKERVSNYDPNKKNYIRQHDPEHVSRNRKQASKNSNFNGYDDEVIRGGKRARSKKPSAQQMMAPIKIETAYMAGDTITVRDLTEKIGKPAGEIIKKLFMLGNMATINSEIDFDTAQLVCSDFEITLERKQEQTAEAALVAEDFDDAEENLESRPPVVTIMGHVDHGKTSLLDYIRKSRVTAGEAGGITQHIGAYTVNVDGRQITFLDTPGHEAFTAMRARGTQATDIAVLVVAADDSVMPQTVESINHAKAAEVPIIVAINKMDKPDANPEKVKQDLTQYGLVCEDWGGETICVPVSAKTGEGVNDLLEMILLQADVLQLQANPNRLGRGVIIEAKLDKARGPLATVLLQNGTLHVGDNIIAGMASGRVRALINDKGERVDSQRRRRDDRRGRRPPEPPGRGRTPRKTEGQPRGHHGQDEHGKPVRFHRGGQGDDPEPDHQGRRAGLRGSGQTGHGEAEQRRGEDPRAAQRGGRHHQGRREPGFCVQRDHHRLQYPAGRFRPGSRGEAESRRSALYGYLQGDRGYGAGHEGPARAGIPRGAAGPCRGAQRLQDHRRRHHCRLLCDGRQSAA